MTQLDPRLAIPQGLQTRRSMHWGVRMLLAGMTVTMVGTAAWVATSYTSVSARIDQEFPRDRRQEVAARMKGVSKLLKDTVLITECPVLPSTMDTLQRKTTILRAQIGQHRGLIVPYIPFKVLLEEQQHVSDIFKTMVADVIVEYKFSSDEQLDLFLDGVNFFVDKKKRVRGVFEASSKLLGKTPENLTPVEVAVLASAVNYVHPFAQNVNHAPTPEVILGKMRDENLITHKDFELAVTQTPAARDRYPASEDE